MTTKIITSVVVAAAALVISAPLAHANSELELISGATTVTVTSGSPYSYNGAVGAWDINVATGLSGGNSIDVNSIDKTTSGTTTPLEILWSVDSQTKLGGYTAQVGGTLSSGLTDVFTSFYGPSLLSTANVLTAALTFSSSPFAGTDSGSVSGSTPFALTEEVVISGASAANSQTSFDFNLSAVPDGGSTLILLGGAMTAMTLIRSRSGKLK